MKAIIGAIATSVMWIMYSAVVVVVAAIIGCLSFFWSVVAFVVCLWPSFRLLYAVRIPISILKIYDSIKEDPDAYSSLCERIGSCLIATVMIVTSVLGVVFVVWFFGWDAIIFPAYMALQYIILGLAVFGDVIKN